MTDNSSRGIIKGMQDLGAGVCGRGILTTDPSPLLPSLSFTEVVAFSDSLVINTAM